MATVVITGANKGIGLEFCRQYQRQKYEVIAVCRKASKELNALDVRLVEGIDVSDDSKVAKLAKTLSQTRINLLINNAGAFQETEFDKLDIAAISEQIDINTLGPVRVTVALRKSFAKTAKVVMITSRMGSINDVNSGGHYGYRISKCALNMVAAILSHDLRAQGVAVGLLHPGYVRTDMTNFQGTIDVKDSVASMIELIGALKPEDNLVLRHSNGSIIPW